MTQGIIISIIAILISFITLTWNILKAVFSDREKFEIKAPIMERYVGVNELKYEGDVLILKITNVGSRTSFIGGISAKFNDKKENQELIIHPHNNFHIQYPIKLKSRKTLEQVFPIGLFKQWGGRKIKSMWFYTTINSKFKVPHRYISKINKRLKQGI